MIAMNAENNTKSSRLSVNKYIQLIHIGKSHLKLDDESYQAVLMGVTNKSSCKDMTISELDGVLQKMKRMGFTPRGRRVPSDKFSPKSRDKKQKSLLDKLRQVWIAMNYAGYLEDGSDKALLSWSKNQVKRFNKSIPIESLDWLKPWMLISLIEQLKGWQKRCEEAERHA